uniref:PP4R3 EVH1-like domain-containing protein n=1 Tax=Monodon monoceros TaxID=40151 RepID=A0A8C6CJW1_MONMO
MTDTRRRVKVYTLNEDRQWDDRGTGHVSSGYVERLKGMSLLVRAKSDGSLLLESKINPNTVYQKQQDTLCGLKQKIMTWPLSLSCRRHNRMMMIFCSSTSL